MEIQLTTLDSGLNVLTVALPGFDTAGAAIIVNGGACDETPDENGIAHFLEHMAFKGTTSRTALDISRSVEICGSNMNAYTSSEETAYHITGLARHLPVSMSILGDIIVNSTLSEDDIAMENGVIQQEIKRSFDSPSSVCYGILDGMIFPDHQMGRPILGTSESVASFRAEHFRHFIARQYCADNTYVVAAGKVDHENVVQMSKDYLERMPVKSARTIPAPSSPRSGVVIDRSRPFEQVSMMMTFGAMSKHDDERTVAFRVFDGVLSGGMSAPLFQEVREKRGLVYSVGGFCDQTLDTGRYLIHAGTTGEHVEELIKVAIGEIRRIAENGPTADDFERAKNGLLVGFATMVEKPLKLGMVMAQGHRLRGFIKPIATRMAEVEAITMDDVRGIAQSLLVSPRSLAMVGPVPVADYQAILAAA